MNEMVKFDESYNQIIAGVDEAGRGPLAGPVVAAAVIITQYFKELEEINDSKKLTAKKREHLFELINKKCIVGTGMADENEIDRINILNATFSAMKRAITDLKEKSDFDIVLVDGNHKIRGYNEKQEAVIKGDSKSLSIAAASIIAKVTRDRLLDEMSEQFPEYGFERHKGYGTKFHREILLEKGPCSYHRKSFLEKILGNKNKNKENKKENN
ncbi:ribonuclease HII [Leptotrichia sp. OH3620_COT-345]|uniref:ribonuclease HII n=1 Tax=Leptotrichia sp. OH3620_COT-345 TaxID=2491048 RepID=UPI000F650B5F|nr:ribonuclease HII [Leptotrichia sp. OH3620_COT-345]RRD40979.1 ribonuclease HII [Leptotrichia sp. OH3620_COT-345]